MRCKIMLSAAILAYLLGCRPPATNNNPPVSRSEKTAVMQDSTPFLGLRTCIYHVADLDAAKKWYEKAFGVAPYFDEPFYVGFEVNGVELGLLPEEEPTTQKPLTVTTYWGVEDIEAAYQRLLAAGAVPVEAPHSVGEPLLVATVNDPWGNLIGMIYNPVFRYPAE